MMKGPIDPRILRSACSPSPTSADPTEGDGQGSPPALRPEWFAQLALVCWRIGGLLQKASANPDGPLTEHLSHHEQALRRLLREGEIEISDQTGQPYLPGMTEEVLAFEERPSVDRECIGETLRPTVFRCGSIILRGQIIVWTPATAALSCDEVPAE